MMVIDLALPTALVVLTCGYLLGSIPIGLAVTHLGGAGNDRAIGSGNIGQTDAQPIGGKGMALLILAGDCGKGIAAVLLARHFLGETAAALAGGAALLGHLFPIWLKFKGGKGVATFLGVILSVTWPAAIMTAPPWLAIAALMGMSPLGALTAIALAPGYAYSTGQAPAIIGLALFMALLVFIRSLFARFSIKFHDAT
jgi:glycerol-3-phosphate acyltransferase PlsY